MKYLKMSDYPSYNKLTLGVNFALKIVRSESIENLYQWASNTFDTYTI